MKQTFMPPVAHPRKQVLSILVLFIFLLLLTVGCSGGDGGGAYTLTGTAAGGAPIEGTVMVRGAGGQIGSASITTGGRFTVDVTNMSPPFFIWARGISNGYYVDLYSYTSICGTANVTPVTNMALFMALKESPQSAFNKGGAIPSATEDAFLQSLDEIRSRLSVLLSDLEVPPDFNLLTGDFSANGVGFDLVLDVLGFEAKDHTAAIKNRATGEVFFEQDVRTGIVSVDKEADEIAQKSINAVRAVKDMGVVFERLSALMADGYPTEAQLEAPGTGIRELMTDDFLYYGSERDSLIGYLADDFTWLSMQIVPGFSLNSISIYRPMVSYSDANGNLIKEYGSHDQGFWCTVSLRNPGNVSFLTGFVYDEGIWKWYGNRIPFTNKEDDSQISEDRSFAEKDVFSDGTTSFSSYLDLYQEDTWDGFGWNLGIDIVYIMGGGLTASFEDKPVEELPSSINGTSAGVIMGRNWESAMYFIVNVPGVEGHKYSEADGLDIAAMESPEYRFVGYDGYDGTPVMAWIELLPARPLTIGELSNSMFATLENIHTHDLGQLHLPGDNLFEWTNPGDPLDEGTSGEQIMFTRQLSLTVDEGSFYFQEDDLNPWKDNPAYNRFDWTRTVFVSTNPPIPGTPTSAVLQISTKDVQRRIFNLNWHFD